MKIATIAVLVVLGVASLLMVIAAPVTAASEPSCKGTTFSGVFTTPFGRSNVPWKQTFDLSDNSPVTLASSQRGTLVQGVFHGNFYNNGAQNQVAGAWSFDPATGNLLMKVVGVGANFYIDYAFLNLPTAGFTFQGSFHMAGQQPVPMAENTFPFPPVIPITC